MRSEADVRKRIKDIWDARKRLLVWVEPTTGSTVGAADLFIPLPNHYYLPVELKFWPRREDGGHLVEMEPSQNLFHYRAGIVNMKTCFIFGDQYNSLLALPGGIAVDFNMSRQGQVQDLDKVSVIYEDDEHLHDITHMDRGEIEALLMSEKFWG